MAFCPDGPEHLRSLVSPVSLDRREASCTARLAP